MVLVDQVPSYPSAASLPPPPPAIATAVLGVPTTAATTSSSLGGGGGNGGSGGGGSVAAATGIPAAPSTNRTAFLGAHLGVRASPLEAFVSTDPSDYAYGTGEFLFFCFLSHRDGGPSKAEREGGKREKVRGRYFGERFRVAPSCRLFCSIRAPLRRSGTDAIIGARGRGDGLAARAGRGRVNGSHLVGKQSKRRRKRVEKESTPARSLPSLPLLSLVFLRFRAAACLAPIPNPTAPGDGPCTDLRPPRGALVGIGAFGALFWVVGEIRRETNNNKRRRRRRQPPPPTPTQTTGETSAREEEEKLSTLSLSLSPFFSPHQQRPPLHRSNSISSTITTITSPWQQPQQQQQQQQQQPARPPPRGSLTATTAASASASASGLPRASSRRDHHLLTTATTTTTTTEAPRTTRTTTTRRTVGARRWRPSWMTPRRTPTPCSAEEEAPEQQTASETE